MSGPASPSEIKGGATLEDAHALIAALLSDYAEAKIPNERLGQHLKDLVRLSRMLTKSPEILAAIHADPEKVADLKRLMVITGTLPLEPETLP